MNKIYFSVWPNVKYNGQIPQALLDERKKTVEVMEAAGFECVIRTDIDENDDILKLMLAHAAPNVRWFTKISDYVRLKYIQEYFDSGYDEIFYGDVDFVIRKLPESFGCAMEIHLQTLDKDGTGPVDKWWNRGVNSCYYFNRSHIPQFQEHFSEVKKTIIAANGNPTFAYPMSNLWPIEQDIGYVDGAFHFGSLKTPDFCTIENIKQGLTLFTKMFGGNHEIKAYNSMGHRDLNGLSTEVEDIFAINDWLKENQPTDELITQIVGRFTPKCRIRPNYNSQDYRQKMRDLISKYRK